MPDQSTIPLGFCQCGCGQPTKVAPKTQRDIGWVKGEPIRYVYGHNGQHPDTLAYIESRLVAVGDCLIWTGRINDRGYGCITHRSKEWKVHRLAYSLRHGPIPTGAEIGHSCDNRACQRDEHHFLTDHRGNMADMVSKARANPLRGEEWRRAHPNAKRS